MTSVRDAEDIACVNILLKEMGKRLFEDFLVYFFFSCSMVKSIEEKGI
jgi:hypothetical protein